MEIISKFRTIKLIQGILSIFLVWQILNEFQVQRASFFLVLQLMFFVLQGIVIVLLANPFKISSRLLWIFLGLETVYQIYWASILAFMYDPATITFEFIIFGIRISILTYFLMSSKVKNYYTEKNPKDGLYILTYIVTLGLFYLLTW